MDFVEAEGDSIDQAIENALKMLDVERDKITVDTLSEGKKGIFGFGAQKARIRAALKTTAAGIDTSEANRVPRAMTDDEVAAIAGKAKSILAEILSLMDVQASVEMKRGEAGDEIILDNPAENNGLFIGRQSQALEEL